MSDAADVIEAKRQLRRTMREMRRALPHQDVLSERVWGHMRALPEVVAAATVMVFDSVPGEPIARPFAAWCRMRGKTVALPEDRPPIDPQLIDVVIVPGLAFTATGDRLGQGGGWYDRFLLTLRTDCVTVGVGFELQLLDDLPTERHDIRLDAVVTDRRVCWTDGRM